ncbi:MAG: LysR family transcriptional regulator [Gammaproteobacteria bacterium]|nr:LysR family transcriptional regulator [Gammaproteobacteria bacterium]NNL99117.1 LysR family transcriptional regulator [Gammaproteobacteria bacterium]
MRYTLRQLEVFAAVAQHGSVTRAAEQLSLSQSSVSSALKEFEAQFASPLFDRAGKRLRLNDRGQRLRPLARDLLERAAVIERQLDDDAGPSVLTIGATLTVGNYLAPNIIARFLEESPAVRVRLRIANTASVVQQVNDFSADVGLIEAEISHPELDITPWRTDELTVFCSPEHALAGRARIGDADLRQARWVLREAGSGTRQTFDRAMGGLLHELDIVMELEQTQAIKQAVMAGLGISCVSRLALEKEFQLGTLVELNTPQRDFSRQFYWLLHRQKFISRGIERWLETCRQFG